MSTAASIFTIIVIILFTTIAAFYYYTVLNYKKTTYFKITGIPYLKMLFDSGRYGEYLTYIYIREYEQNGAKFLFNVYLPRENNETTEIDVLMIYKSGLYVFESKNYSGWIFGDEKSKNWTQTLPSGRKSHKEHFFNPIMQNKLHIKWLLNALERDIPTHSIIVFSERCTLKSINNVSSNIKVIKRGDVKSTVDQIDLSTGEILTNETIDEIYNKLYNSSQVDENTKEKHIENIKQRIEDNAVNNNPVLPDETKHICPRCGSLLVLRTAKKGENAGKSFYGCSSYPKCRYIKKD